MQNPREFGTEGNELCKDVHKWRENVLITFEIHSHFYQISYELFILSIVCEK